MTPKNLGKMLMAIGALEDLAETIEYKRITDPRIIPDKIRICTEMISEVLTNPVTMKLKCNHCQEVIESGIVNVSEHAYSCKAAITNKVSEMYSIVTYPAINFSIIAEPDPQA